MRFREQLDELKQQAQAGELVLCFFDESGFSPNPPMQSGWTPIGQTRSCCPGAHNQRINVLGCLEKDGPLIWEAIAHSVTSEDVAAFFERYASALAKKTVVILDNAGIHRSALIQEKRLEWERQGLYFQYLPAYSPELNAIEILWKQAKYFWRRFLVLSDRELLNEVESVMKGFGTRYTINFQ